MASCLSGDPNYTPANNNDPDDPIVPAVYSRILNNTIYNSNDGIRIVDGAAPTLLNNVLVENGTGIRGQNEGPTIIRATVFDRNGTPVNGVSVGTEELINPARPLFVNPDDSNFNLAGGNPNFYPEQGSVLIDSSIDGQLDRTSIIGVRAGRGHSAQPHQGHRKGPCRSNS